MRGGAAANAPATRPAAKSLKRGEAFLASVLGDDFDEAETIRKTSDAAAPTASPAAAKPGSSPQLDGERATGHGLVGDDADGGMGASRGEVAARQSAANAATSVVETRASQVRVESSKRWSRVRVQRVQ